MNCELWFPSCANHKLSDFLLVQEIAELYEQEQNFEQAMAYYDKAADLFQGEEVTSSANQCRLKLAQFAAELQQYEHF